MSAMISREARDRADAYWTTLVSIASVAMLSCAYWWFILRTPGFFEITTAAQFAGTAERFNSRVEEVVPSLTLGDVQRALVYSILFSVLLGVVGTALLYGYWRKSWRAGIGARISGRALGLFFGAGAASIAVVELILTLVVVVETDGGVRFAETAFDWAPKTILVLGWYRSAMIAVLVLLVASMVVSPSTAFLRRRLPALPEGLLDTLPPTHDPSRAPDAPAGIGICCSGGGLKAAGFSLGALAKLEEEPSITDHRSLGVDEARIPIPTAAGKLGIVGRARYLAGVSGGGYAAAAWRIAAGTGQLPDGPIVGNPSDPTLDVGRIRRFPSPSEPAVTLVQHVRERRRYLANGPGGLVRSALTTFLLTAFHFGLFLLAVYVTTWPLGRLVVSWAVTGTGRAAHGLPSELAFDVGLHQWFPPLASLAITGLALGARLPLDRVRLRTYADRVATAAALVGAVLAMLLLVLPFVLDQFLRFLSSGSGGLAIAGFWASVLTAILRVISGWLNSAVRAAGEDVLRQQSRFQVTRVLGSVALFIGLSLFPLWVIANAASEDAMLSSGWIWAGSAMFLFWGFVLFNPDRWSLHGLHRRSLAGTFATRRLPSGFIPHTAEPPLSDYAQADGPSPVVCCAIAREHRRQTGLQALSMTFEPECITVYRWTGLGDVAELWPERISHAQFQRRLPRNRHGNHVATLMGATAISGGALAPSLSRSNPWSTNALLAGLNARLGVWVPNPRAAYTRSTTPRLVNLVKEITQTYDPDDPNVFAVDGSHWEALGLVELIRRRCATIICIDATVEPAGTYHRLKEAIKLASLECGATVEMLDEGWASLALDDDRVATKNHARGVVTYADGTTANLIYVKAAISRSSPPSIQRYAAEHAGFPNYSPFDTLPSDQELAYIMQLGYDSMGEALDAYRDVVANSIAALARPTRPVAATKKTSARLGSAHPD